MKLQALAWPSLQGANAMETLTVRMAGDGATDATVVLPQHRRANIIAACARPHPNGGVRDETR